MSKNFLQQISCQQQMQLGDERSDKELFLYAEIKHPTTGNTIGFVSSGTYLKYYADPKMLGSENVKELNNKLEVNDPLHPINPTVAEVDDFRNFPNIISINLNECECANGSKLRINVNIDPNQIDPTDTKLQIIAFNKNEYGLNIPIHKDGKSDKKTNYGVTQSAHLYQETETANNNEQGWKGINLNFSEQRELEDKNGNIVTQQGEKFWGSDEKEMNILDVRLRVELYFMDNNTGREVTLRTFYSIEKMQKGQITFKNTPEKIELYAYDGNFDKNNAVKLDIPVEAKRINDSKTEPVNAAEAEIEAATIPVAEYRSKYRNYEKDRDNKDYRGNLDNFKEINEYYKNLKCPNYTPYNKPLNHLDLGRSC